MPESGSSAELQKRNRATIDLFFSRTVGVDELYTEDGVKELTFGTFLTPDGEPLRWAGIEELRKNFAANQERAVSFQWKNVVIYETQDPNKFWAECEGEGVLKNDGVARPYVQKNYFIFFGMRDGRIALLREIMNPLELLKTIGGSYSMPGPAVKY